MTPLNYLRQATERIAKDLPALRASFPEYANKTNELLRECAKAKKFVLPDGGRIFDDNLRGLPDVLRLPFPEIVIEYRAGSEESLPEQVFGTEGTQAVPKRIAYAQEMDGWIDVVVICGSNDGRWQILPYGVSIRKAEPGDVVNESGLIGKTSAVHISSVVLMLWKFGEIADEIEDWESRAEVDTADESNTVLSLIEALSCINVGHESIAVRKQNKSSKKRGALPFDEYHTLVIKPNSSKEKVESIGDGRSPREHLRRGHIRRIDGNRRVWVNACVVNPGTAGKIVSDYRVKP